MDVCIILGSKSDMPVCDKCTSVLTDLSISHSVHVASAHRTPKHLESVIENALELFDILMNKGKSYKISLCGKQSNNMNFIFLCSMPSLKFGFSSGFFYRANASLSPSYRFLLRLNFALHLYGFICLYFIHLYTINMSTTNILF